jgi:hypothetical protein
MNKWWAVSDKHGNIYAIRKYEMDILNIVKPGDKVFTVELSDRKFMWEIDENGNIQNKKEIESMKNNGKEVKAEEGYQGWSNHATWVINLHLDNEQSTQEMKREIVLETRNEDKEKWIYDAAETLKGWVEETMPDLPPMWADMLNGYFDEVDFREIAEHGIDEIGYDEENEKNKGKDLKKEFE